MKPGLAEGATRTQRFDVDEARCITFMGEALSVYATPFMVRDVERVCRLLLEEYLTEEENSVGSHVEIDHLGPTLKGMWVDVKVTVTLVDRRRIDFEAEVSDPIEVVGRAKHTRFVLMLDKQRERLKAKAARFEELDKG